MAFLYERLHKYSTSIRTCLFLDGNFYFSPTMYGKSIEIAKKIQSGKSSAYDISTLKHKLVRNDARLFVGLSYVRYRDV